MVRGFEFVNLKDMERPEKAKLPVRASAHSAGYDFYTPFPLDIPPHTTMKVGTFVKAKMPSDEVLFLFIRSSMGIKKNIGLANQVGVIDSDYYGNKDNDGHIIAALHNFGEETVHIDAGERIVQGVFVKFSLADGDTAVGERIGGIGSSGK